MIGLNKIIKVFAVHPMANTKLIVNNSYLVKKKSHEHKFIPLLVKIIRPQIYLMVFNE